MVWAPGLRFVRRWVTSAADEDVTSASSEPRMVRDAVCSDAPVTAIDTVPSESGWTTKPSEIAPPSNSAGTSIATVESSTVVVENPSPEFSLVDDVSAQEPV